GRPVLRLHRPCPTARRVAQRLLPLRRHLSSHSRGPGNQGSAGSEAAPPAPGIGLGCSHQGTTQRRSDCQLTAGATNRSPTPRWVLASSSPSVPFCSPRPLYSG